ncbi:hypothetical protein RS75_23545 [Rhizobium nepotum 39/7]|uniref:Uncharacterized protein n=1 Tax=Rhizobium nepotum 39/7 TaxID=1368418 RepID=A0ABR5CKF9_9HYPH|nr:hypothetical protein RS75_23545 [Rhizobium nepotum 39/7]
MGNPAVKAELLMMVFAPMSTLDLPVETSTVPKLDMWAVQAVEPFGGRDLCLLISTGAAETDGILVEDGADRQPRL